MRWVYLIYLYKRDKLKIKAVKKIFYSKVFLFYVSTFIFSFFIKSSPLFAKVQNPKFLRIVSTNTTAFVTAWTDQVVTTNSYQVAISSRQSGNPIFTIVSASFTTPVGISTAGFSPLVPNQTYWFIVKSTAEDDTGYITSIATVTFPESPVIAALSDVTTGQITANWTNASNSTDTLYNVQASSQPFSALAGAPLHSATTSANATSYNFSNLAANATYNFQVRALWAGDGNTGTASTAYISLGSTSTFPVLPNLTLVSVAASSFTVSVNKGGNSNNSPYEISFSPNSDFGLSVTTSAIGTLPSGNTSFANLTGNVTYYIRARALWNSAGSNLLFNASGYTLSIATFVPQAAPTAPSAFTVAAVSQNSMTFGWTDISSNEDGFRVLNSTSGILGTVNADITSFQVTGLSPNQLVVSNGVSAFNAGGASTATTSYSSYTLANPPANLSFVTVKKTEITITWSTNSNSASTLYEISQSTDSFAFAPGISTPVPFSSNLTYSTSPISNLTGGGTYYFRVRAQNGDGVATNFSSSISTITPAIEVVQSTGGTVCIGATCTTADPGVTITFLPLFDGTTQQTLVSTQTAKVSYDSGITLQLSGGQCTVIATADSVQITSTGTIPITNSGFTIESTSGTSTIRATSDTLAVTLATTAPQDVSATLISSGTKTLEVNLNPPSGVITTLISPDTLSDVVKVRFQIPNSAFPAISATLLKTAPEFQSFVDENPLHPALSLSPSILKGIGIGLEISLSKAIQPLKLVPITITYRDSDISGSAPEILTLARFEDSIQKWVTLSSIVDSKSRTVRGTTKHFSKFQLMALTPATDVNQPKVYPNPLRTHLGQTEMVFTNLSSQASLKIYTYLGELARELKADATGTARWDAKNSYNEKVASGVYLVLIEGGQDSQKVIKVAVEK